MSRSKDRMVLNNVLVLLAATGLSVCLFLLRYFASGSIRYWFMLWNLLLAWLPLAFAWWLHQRLKRSPWLNWPNLALTFFWLGFLPNSFYLMSDIIHLTSTGEISVLYDAALMLSFIFNGMILGYLSVIIVHKQLLRRVPRIWAHGLIAVTLFVSSFAIYLGRYLRWNTWDIILNPFGLLFDISERLINPLAHLQTYSITLTFFAVIGMFYIVAYNGVRLLKEAS